MNILDIIIVVSVPYIRNTTNKPKAKVCVADNKFKLRNVRLWVTSGQVNSILVKL